MPRCFWKACKPAQHVEVQIIADHYGTTWAVGVRDCTIQRRHQKVLEEAPSPVLSPGSRTKRYATRSPAEPGGGYPNAGTVEFVTNRRATDSCSRK